MNHRAPILVVEDEKSDALLIRRTLGKAGLPYPLHFVETGEQAIAYLSELESYSDRNKHPMPALVLLDLKLPGKSGFEVLEWVRANPLFKMLRVVVLTSSKDIRDVRQAYKLGANSFLVKPLEFENMSALMATIGTQLWKANTRTETEDTVPRTNKVLIV